MNDTREHILRVSYKLFLKKSYKEVTMKELVENSGLSKGAFYHYFEGKEQLFGEVIDKSFSDFSVDYSKFSHDSLYEFFHDYIKFINERMELFKKNNDCDSVFDLNYFSLIFDACKLIPSFYEKLNANLQDELNAWTAIIKLAREKGEIKSPMSDEQIARIFIYTNDASSLQNILKGQEPVLSSSLLQLWKDFYEEIKE
ncbi:TetR/AcrR family transcriptional regulator [Clostridium sp. PL3]|uniref:TetR/AcrR family transcriptional regulator n=1 Tax=Clostridium thailandense TaxID=2794346 RepID=A0A949TXD3_9CLOT|nr:TetR/AcrR family transcriptional regulator [Clostridium thailandense]MBV7276987.1 TetR/AcrR family transcriptional regulator [Clostridium thailandense]